LIGDAKAGDGNENSKYKQHDKNFAHGIPSG
jgi:hypothetical protein